MEMEENKGIRKGKPFAALIFKSVSEVSGAVLTAQLTTIVSFIPVFLLEAQEGKLFGPLAFTKTFAMICAYLLGIIVLPTLVYYIFSVRISSKQLRKAANIIMAVAGVALLIISGNGLYLVLPLFAINNLLAHTWKNQNASNIINIGQIGRAHV